MASNNTTLSVTYTDQQLRILIEEFIAMQRSEFTFKGVCSYILYRAMEDEKTKVKGIFESNELHPTDCDRVSDILDKIVQEGRIANVSSSLYEKLAS